MHAADPHDEVLRLALAVHADLHVKPVGGDPGPALGDGDPAEGKVPGGGAGRRANGVQPRVGPGRPWHLVGVDHAEPEIRVVPGEISVRVQAQGGAQRGQCRQIEVAWHRQPGIHGGHDVQAASRPVAGQAAEQFRGPVADARREAGQDQDVVGDRGPGGGRVVGLHRVVDVGQPGLGDLHDVAGQRGQQGFGLGGAGRDPAPRSAHPHLGGQAQERGQVPALPHRIGQREPHRARPGRGGQPQRERLQQRPCSVGEPALADQQVAVAGEPRHGRRGRQAVACPEDPDAQAVRRRRLRVGLIGRPGRGAETVQRPRMRGGQRRHGAEQGSGSLSVQVVPLAVARYRRRGSQAKVGAMDLALDRLERHIHLCNQPAHPHGQPGALDRQP